MEPQLTEAQFFALQTQFDVTPGLNDTNEATGEHYVLMAMLNEMGFYPTDREDLMDMTEELLSHGWS